MRIALATLALVLIAPFLYYGAYRLMIFGRTQSVDLQNRILGAEMPDYRYGGRFSEVVFYPAYVIDKVVRPDEWSGESRLAAGVYWSSQPSLRSICRISIRCPALMPTSPYLPSQGET